MANVQIHELSSHSGALGSTDYLATDDGTNTTKIAVTELTALMITTQSFNSLPKTISDARIKANMVVLNSWLSNPSAQTSDWEITTSDGSIEIGTTGTISGSTTATLIIGIGTAINE